MGKFQKVLALEFLSILFLMGGTLGLFPMFMKATKYNDYLGLVISVAFIILSFVNDYFKGKYED
jgi:nicotinamide riboside transporter PnuC